jgi:hypothetical protein
LSHTGSCDVILCGFITLREEHILRVLENREFRNIFGPKGEKVTRMEKIT